MNPAGPAASAPSLDVSAYFLQPGLRAKCITPITFSPEAQTSPGEEERKQGARSYTAQGCTALQRWDWQSASPDFTCFPPSHPLSPQPLPSPPASPALTPLKRYPRASAGCGTSSPLTQLPKDIPPPPRHTHVHTCPRNWRGERPGRRLPGRLSSSGVQSPGPCPRPLCRLQFPHFPQGCFSPSPPHLGLRGSCTIPWELQVC